MDRASRYLGIMLGALIVIILVNFALAFTIGIGIVPDSPHEIGGAWSSRRRPPTDPSRRRGAQTTGPVLPLPHSIHRRRYLFGGQARTNRPNVCRRISLERDRSRAPGFR